MEINKTEIDIETLIAFLKVIKNSKGTIDFGYLDKTNNYKELDFYNFSLQDNLNNYTLIFKQKQK